MSSDTSTLPIPSEPHQRRKWIIYQLQSRGLTLAAIGGELGVIRQAVSDALIRPSARIEEAIAAKLGTTPQELFPERFDSDGHRLHRPRPRREQPRRDAGEAGDA